MKSTTAGLRLFVITVFLVHMFVSCLCL